MNQLRQNKLLFFSLGLNLALVMVLVWSQTSARRGPMAPSAASMQEHREGRPKPDDRDRGRGDDKRPWSLRRMQFMAHEPPPFPPPFFRSAGEYLLTEAGVTGEEAETFWQQLEAKDPEFEAQFQAMHQLRRELMEALLDRPDDDALFAGLRERFHAGHLAGFDAMLARGRAALLALTPESRTKLAATIRSLVAAPPPPGESDRRFGGRGSRGEPPPE